MRDPHSMGDGQLFREDFVSKQGISDNGGVITGTPTIRGGKATFTTGEYIYYPNKRINYGGAFTVSGYVTLTGDAGAGAVWSDGESTYNTVLYQSGSSTQLAFYVKTASGLKNATHTLKQDTRTHVTCVYDKTEVNQKLRIYINGVLASSGTGYAEDLDEPVGPFGVATYGSAFIGDIEPLTVTEGACTAQEVLDEYNGTTYSALDASKSLIYLPGRTGFNDGSNEVTENLGSEGNLICGDGSTASTYPSFTPPKEMSFDGLDYLKTTGTITTTTSDSFLFHCRLSTTDTGTRYIFDLRDGSNEGLAIYKTGAGLITAFTNDGGLNPVVGSKAINDGSEHDVVVAFNNVSATKVNISIRIDGELDVSTEVDIWSVITSKIFISATVGASAGWVGTMKDVGVWKTTGTPRQARWLHERSLKELNV